ncbi:MAG: NAD(+)/NADH kinase [Christensenellales bacterium]
MRVGLYYRNNDSLVENKCLEFSERFHDEKIDCFITTEVKSVKDVDALIVFGGDGTVLEAVRHVSKYGVPILGINLGNLGFLSELEQNATFEETLNVLKNGEIKERMMLNVKVGDNVYSSLNDIVVKSLGSRPVYLVASVDGEFLDEYRSDGVIVCTPTGSTAYSLSAGGPILSPDLNAMALIPVCPHTLHSRPIVISSDSVVKLSGLKAYDKMGLVVDGNTVQEIDSLKEIMVYKSDVRAKFYSVSGNGFYKRLLTKMNRWGVTKD